MLLTTEAISEPLSVQTAYLWIKEAFFFSIYVCVSVCLKPHGGNHHPWLWEKFQNSIISYSGKILLKVVTLAALLSSVRAWGSVKHSLL